jgi:hypothetical protein
MINIFAETSLHEISIRFLPQHFCFINRAAPDQFRPCTGKNKTENRWNENEAKAEQQQCC